MSYPDFSSGFLSLGVSGTITAGEVVKMASADTVATGTDGVDFLGIARVVDDDDYVGVQIDGIMEAVYADGETFLVGSDVITGAALGKVKQNTTGISVQILKVDATNKKIWFIRQ